MPIHGELRHLVKNGQLAVSTGVPASRVVLADGGVTVDLKDGQARISGQVPCELVFVDGKSIGEISEEELEIRRILGSEGFISVYAVVEHDSGMVLSGPTIKAIGMAEDDAVFDEVLPDVEDALKDAAAPGGKDPYVLQQAMRRVLGRWVARRLRRRPMIVPVSSSSNVCSSTKVSLYLNSDAMSASTGIFTSFCREIGRASCRERV